MQIEQHAKKTGLPIQGLAELIFRPYDQALGAENNISIVTKDTMICTPKSQNG
jgi:hypothetical protein